MQWLKYFLVGVELTEKMVASGMLAEIMGQSRNRIFVLERYLNAFRACSEFSHRVKNGLFFAIFHLFSVT